jgi:hypothetical protein
MNGDLPHRMGVAPVRTKNAKVARVFLFKNIYLNCFFFKRL